MLQRWKRIISNWNNCFIEDDKHEKHITKESVIHIICYLRQNFNLDQSKSSIVEARTVEEFINEKYPEFVFEHGTAAPADQDELYLVASLLLFFVCVNSKDTYLKHTMCSKLRTEDQEIILKFSKKLMECRVISCGDVKAAITEACGLEEATTDRRPSVAETPPVLRSLHSEVRRLQAALDAEQFDRNYLQEELTRTNARLEKLSKEKEQFKLEISNLKSQVSSRDEDRDSPRGSSGPGESRAASRVKTLEDRLDELAMQLHDLEAERDQYKSKLEDLKQDRDKWVTEWQHESARVAQLTEELETERQQGAGMRELLAELTEHNKLNRGDSSMVECDYLDASVRSLPHNTSLCTEACANVVEVQLGEERARIVVLQQQIQSLQDQITELNKQYDDEKLLYQTTLSDRENTIFNLKHRINEEIEEKDKIKSFYDNEMTKLNNEINELEQSLKETSEHSHSVIETKMAEIQTLQEEKLSLIHSLNTETTKLDNVIKSLQNELDNEKLSKSKMKEGYENHLMKLNEKVLNRNNELVELQNSIFEKGEKIETLQIELRKVKEVKDELLNKYHELDEQKMAAEEMIREKTDQVNNLQTKLDENNNIIDELQTEVTGLKQTVSDLSDNCKLLEDTKQTALKNIEELRHDAETLKTMFTEQIDKLTIDLDEKNAHVTSLQTQLKGEITFKIELHNEVATLISIHEVEMGKFKQANDSINKYMKELQDKEKMIDGLDLYIKEVKRSFEVANKKITDLSARLEQKNDEIKTLEQQIEAMKLSFEQAAKLGDEAKIQLDNILLEKEELLEKNQSLDGEVASKDRELIEIQGRLTELQQKYIEREKKSEEANREISEYLSKCFRIVDEMNEDWENDSLQNIVACENDTITNKCTSLIKLVEALTGEVVNIKSALKCESETKERMKEEIMEKETEILELRTEVQTLEKTVDDTKIELSKQTESYTSSLNDLKALQQENQTLASELTTVKMQLEVKVHSLKEKLVDSELLTDKLKSSYDLQIDNLNLMVAKLTNFLKEKTIEVDGLKKEKEDLLASGDEKRGVIKTLEEVLKTERQNMDILLSDFELERQALKDKLSDSESVVEKLTTSHELEVQNFNLMLKKMSNSLKEKAVEIQTLQKQKEDLFTSVAESCKVIKSLENDMTTEKLNMDKMLADFESERQVLRNMVTVTESVMDDQKQTLNSIIEDYKKDIETLRDDNKALKETVNKLKSKLSGSEIANDSLSSLMKKERELKLFVEEESEILREYLDDAMKELCYEIGLSSNLKGDKDHLSVELEKCRNELQAILKCEESEKLQKIRENIELNNMIEQVNETLSAVMKEKDTLQAEKSKLVEENNEHESRIKENNIQFIMLRKENEELVAQNQQYSDNVKDINEKLYNLTKMTNELETQNRQSIDEVEKLKLEIDNLVKQKEKLEIEHVQLLIQNKHYTKEIEVAKRKIDDVIEEKDQLELEKNNLIEENTENVNKIAEVNEKLNNFLKKKEVLESDNRKRFEEIKEVKCKLDSLQTEKKQLKTEKEQLTDEKESLKQQKEQLELENSRLITENRENGQKIIEVTERLNNLIKNKDVFEVDHTKQIEEMKCKLDALQTEKKLFETEKEQLTKEKDVLELEKEQLVAQNREHASKTEEVYQKLNVLQKSEIESNKHYEDINKKMESLVKEKEELQIKIKQLISENKQYVAEIEGVREKMYELVKQKEMIDTEKVQLIAESKENANKIEEITEKFNALVKDKTDLELENKNNIAEIKAVAVRIDAILEEKLQLETEKSQLITENKELGSKVEEITQKLEHVLKSNYDLENENKQKILQVEVEKEHLETEKKQLAIENEEKMNKIKDLTEQLNDVVTVKMELETQNIKYVEEIEEIKCKIHILLTEKKELDAEKEHLVAEKQELVHKIDEIRQTLDNVQKQKTEAEFENIKLNAEINEVKTKIDSLRDETEQLEIERNELLTQNKEQKNKIEEINEKITSVLEEKRHLEVDKIEFEAKINELIKLKSDNEQLTNAVEESKTVICQLEQLINQELQQKQTENEAEVGSSTFIQNEGVEAMLRQKETQLTEVHRQIECMKERIDMFEKDCVEKDHIISKMSRDKDDIINKISKELVEERLLREKLEKELEVQKKVMCDVKTNLEMELLRKENERLVRAIGQHETLAAVCRQPAGGEQPSPAAIDQKELFNEQMAVMKSRQREEMLALEANARRAEDARRDAEQHIRELTRELWAVGEKYLVKNDEAEWLKRKHRSGSLMSLQHTHSAGLSLPQEPPSRPSDAQSLRSLPVTNKRERGLAVYEEDGEVFDNRWLKELNTPRRGAGAGAGGAERLSELRYRNSLCLPHLKSSYPAETQFVPAANEDDIKALGKQRKEVGITAYKKPGPPTPSKQAGRLSATDSELRESLRVENEPYPDRKTSTPARIRAFLSFKKNDTNDGTPRRRLSNLLFRKK